MRRTEPELEDATLGSAYDRRLMARLWEVTRPHGRLLWLSLLLFPLTSAVELLQPYLIKVAIDEHILKMDWAGLGRMAAFFLGSVLVLYVLRTAQAYVTQLTGQRVMHDLRRALFAHLQRMEASFFDRNPVGRLMARMLGDVEAINEMFVSGVVVIVGDVITLVGVVVIMLGMNWRLALVTFAVVPVLAVGAAWLRLRARDSYRRVRAQSAALTGSLQEAIQGMPVIQLFTREAQEARAFGLASGALRAAQLRSTIYEASLYASVEAIGSVAVALLLWHGGGQVLVGTLTFGGLVAFLEYTSRFFLPIRDLGAKYTVMQAAMVSAERVFGLLDVEPAIKSPAAGQAPRIVPLVAGHDGRSRPAGGDDGPPPALELRNVWFAYGGDRWVLRDCSFSVAQGEHVALVGPTGEGKSTIVRLMTRSHDVVRGQVLVDGVDVRHWDLSALRRHVGLVPQEVFLFAGTVRANLTLGRDGMVGDEEIERAVGRANAGALLRSLPRGLHEEIRERGVNLSHGQRQLLAIARALIYNPRVLALDEATSSVDPESEGLIRSALIELLRGRTSVVIAHRLSTIQSADRILVLHRGRIRESGSHAALLAAGGLYARLCEIQFGRARA